MFNLECYLAGFGITECTPLGMSKSVDPEKVGWDSSHSILIL